MPRTHRRFGWIRDLPDIRDHIFPSLAPKSVTLPTSVDLRGTNMPPVYDQGNVGSCTGNSSAGAIQFERRKQGLSPDFVPSRLFLYYNARVLAGDVDEDGGAQIRDVIKGAVSCGAPAETDWPYDETQVLTKPSDAAYSSGKLDLPVQYKRIQPSLWNYKQCLASGFPFVFGFTVYESFESPQVAQTGQVPMPGPNEGILGGHAVMGSGYDDSTQRFLVRNSWSTNWGQAGFFTVPYEFMDPATGIAADFWVIQKMVA